MRGDRILCHDYFRKKMISTKICQKVAKCRIQGILEMAVVVFRKKINPFCTWKVSETTGGCMKVWAAIRGGKVGNVGNGLGGCAGCCEVAAYFTPRKFHPGNS